MSSPGFRNLLSVLRRSSPTEYVLTGCDPTDLAAECLRSIEKNSLRTRLTDQRLLDQVVGVGGTPEGFLFGGFMATVGIRSVVRSAGATLSRFTRILDFGCGPARLACWLGDVASGRKVLGTDINAEAIDWSVRNIGFDAEFFRNEPLPPLPLPDESVDLVYGLSVFTHLDEDYQFRWLQELARITRPGAILVLTIHGEDKARADLPEPALAQYLKSGFLYMKAPQERSVAGLPDFYQVAFHRHSYIARHWSRYFEPLFTVKHGPFWVQDALVLQKPGRGHSFSRRNRSYPIVRLPLASIDSPSSGQRVTGESFDLTGWAFYMEDPEPVPIAAWIDGTRIETDTLRQQRQDVADTHKLPQARDSGFTLRLPTRQLGPGTHVLWLTSPDAEIPITATYFLVEENGDREQFRSDSR